MEKNEKINIFEGPKGKIEQVKNRGGAEKVQVKMISMHIEKCKEDFKGLSSAYFTISIPNRY